MGASIGVIGLVFAAAVATVTGASALARPGALTAAGSSWIHVAHIAGLRGGLPTSIEALTAVANAGAEVDLQISRETDQDEILELRERRSACSDLVESLFASSTDLPASGRENAGSGGVVIEGRPPRLRVALGLPGHRPQLWEGDEDRAPPQVVRLAAQARACAARGGDGVSLPAGVYLRAWLLPPAAARALRGGSVGRRALAASPALEAALAHPYRLLPVAPASNPFAPLWSRFAPGRGALEVHDGGRIFQLRSLTYGARAR